MGRFIITSPFKARFTQSGRAVQIEYKSAAASPASREKSWRAMA